MNTVGRPTLYDEETILSKSREYLDACVDEEDEYHKTRGDKSDSYERIVRVRIPTIEGLAVHLKVSRDTIYNWKEAYPAFFCIIEELQATQADRLLQNGLNGDYNATIAKVLLTKHGYKEQTEIGGIDGKPISITFDPVFNATTPKTEEHNPVGGEI